ncbi:YgdB family protein [Yersinia massiliensis]|uniref:YgdB family protein n=1 Tax=Yersinia massiliensis TaxID=419257 RepID=UPI00031F9B4E|nr:YgdB family protein [Yersinia massiliensis]MCB5310075.1 YgdB family protein [Yersinia massiliensis]
MKQSDLRGASTLTAIAVLFALGLLLLSALHRQLDNIQQITAVDKRYLSAFNQATSSLNWGISQRWLFTLVRHTNAAWHCQEKQLIGLKACIKPASLAGFYILRGESQSIGTTPPLILYQRVKLKNKNNLGYQLVKDAHGWLDFCPDKDAQYCIH